VDFNGVPAASFNVNSDASITAVTPALVPLTGPVEVQVFGPGGMSASNSNSQFTFTSPVTVTGLSPNQGLEVGGNTVSIAGTYFAAGATVMFGNSPCTNVQVGSPNSLTCTVPPGVGVVQVTVTTAQGTSSYNPNDLYTYLPPPTVSGIVPPNGLIAGGYGVTINGTGFTSGVTVYFGTKPATDFVVLSTTDIAANVPPGVSMSGGVVDVTVVTADGTSAITGADQFDYLSPVTVTGISPVTGPPAGGTQVVITGTDFTGATAVNFGGNPATFTVNSATQITATSPAGGGTVDITVTTPPYSSGPINPAIGHRHQRHLRTQVAKRRGGVHNWHSHWLQPGRRR
jgi:hypothetical protein